MIQSLIQRFVITFAACMIAAAGASTAQAQQGEFAGETTVNVVEVPVRAVNSKTGEAITGLQASDFIIRENGHKQNLTNFQEIRRETATTNPGEESVDAASEETKALEIVYFFDLFLMEKGDKNRALDALRQRYRSSLSAHETISVVSFDGELNIHVNRSTDPFDVLDGLDEIEELRARGIEQYLGFTQALASDQNSGERDQEFYERRQRSKEYFHEMERRVRRVGNALSATMARFAVADGRKALVAFTPGFPGSSWSPTYSPIDFLNASARYPAQELWRRTALEAADLGFTLFVVDSSGLRANAPSDADIGITDQIGESFAQGELFGPATSARREDVVETDVEITDVDPNAGPKELGGWIERTRKNLLVSATQTTGGMAQFEDDVNAALELVDDNLQHYYSLAYQAEHSGDGQEYEIEVELPGHPEAKIIHRTSYIDFPASTRKAQRLRSAMLFGGDANPLGIQIEVGDTKSRFRLGAAGSKRIQVPFHLRIPFARIEMIDHGESFNGELLITFFGEDAEGNQSEIAAFEQAVSVAASDYQDAIARGYFSYHATIEIEGGQQRVFVGVQDALSGRTSIMPQEFDF